MAHPDLNAEELRQRVPPSAGRAFGAGEEAQALTLLRRARDAEVPGSVPWAVLERLTGLVLIHLLREVEGTFALERADAVLEAADVVPPDLEWLAAAETEER